ncbi:outer membrane protein assembly factor BamA [Striga asiatica]|uniref:Outer membrane protein assembly factor BamA n=1 Tax=Striga asiatica TaxID=4170 RepID=A0A5A7QFG6_STRAF|nr:outer membrane protein assembly factor BamA [Striga asiatica]
MSAISLDRDTGALLTLLMNNRFSITALNLLPVLLTKNRKKHLNEEPEVYIIGFRRGALGFLALTSGDQKNEDTAAYHSSLALCLRCALLEVWRIGSGFTSAKEVRRFEYLNPNPKIKKKKTKMDRLSFFGSEDSILRTRWHRPSSGSLDGRRFHQCWPGVDPARTNEDHLDN